MKQRILFIAPLPPPVHGSAVVSRQIKDSVVINDAFICDWVNLSASRRTEELWKNKPVKLLRISAAFTKTLVLLLRHRYDLCYLAITCHGRPFLKDAPFVLLCKLFGRRIVIHQHNKGMDNDVSRWPFNFMLPLVYKNVSVILLSKRLYHDIGKVVPETNVLVCPNGIQVDNRFRAVAGQPSTPRLLFLSNLMESKGVWVLLEALQKLNERGYDFCCTFAGGQTREISFERFASEVKSHNLEKQVVCRGALFDEEKEQCFRDADLFVFPSYNECFPLVILEAMSYGLPVVTTDEGGIPDIVEDGVTGIVIEKNNPQSLADEIARLLDDETLRHDLGAAGRLRLESGFTQEVFEHNMLSCLQACIEKR